MTSPLPKILGRRYYSAAVMNEFTKSLLSSYSWAIAPRAPFSALKSASSGTDLWAGYILYTGDTDTFRYRYNQVSGGAGATVIKMGGSTIHTNTGGNGANSGSVSIAGQCTAGEVYSVTVSNANYYTDPCWLGLSLSIDYTSPPTFSSGCVLTDVQLDDLRSSLCQLELAYSMPHIPNIMGRKGKPRDWVNIRTPGTVWRGYFCHTNDTLKYRFRYGGIQYGVKAKLYYNATQVASWTDITWDTTKSGSLDISGLGLTKGNFYECYVTVEKHGGPDVRSDGFMWLYEIAEYSSASVDAPPLWEHGGQNVTACNLNKYSHIIDMVHPSASAPVSPLYYEQPALQTDETGYRYYIQHRRKWLRYRVFEQRTAEIEYGPTLGQQYALSTGSANLSFDMSTFPAGLGIGQYYILEDSTFACEYDTEQP